MSNNNNEKALARINFDQLAKSLERLSLFDGRGKAHMLQISPKVDLMKLLGNLDLETIEARM